MRNIPGVVIGLVHSVDDPRGEGRIQVRFPWLPDVHEHPWAPVATPMAGAERGMFFMPELEDEVLVAFEHGDFDHPFVVGFLWNGAARPPDDNINTSVRRLRTVSGHVLEFDDRERRERILIKTKNGHEIEMKDMPPPAQIRITTTGGNYIVISDAPPRITISTRAGIMNLEAPIVNLNGTVQTPTIIARSVVGASYTPAPGNTFGA